MRGDPSALQIKGHTKTQRAPSDIIIRRFPFLKILLGPPYSINKIIMGSWVKPSLRSSGLAGKKLWSRLGRHKSHLRTLAEDRIVKIKDQTPGP